MRRPSRAPVHVFDHRFGKRQLSCCSLPQSRTNAIFICLWNSPEQLQNRRSTIIPLNAAGRRLRHAHRLTCSTVRSYNVEDLRCPGRMGSAAHSECASSVSKQVSFCSHDARALNAHAWSQLAALRISHAKPLCMSLSKFYDSYRLYCKSEFCVDAGVYCSFSCLDRPSRVVVISQESRVLSVVRVIRASIRRIPNVCGELL